MDDEAGRFLTVEGHRIRVAVRGSGSPLLLINGLGGNLEGWAPLTRAIRGRELIVYDAPGTGRSPTPWRPLSIAAHARIARGILDALGHERVDVLGLSFGGGVAQTMAHRHPHRVRSLILAATGCGLGGVPGNPLALAVLATPLRYHSPSHYRVVAPILFGGRSRRRGDRLDEYIAARTSLPPSVRGYFWQLWALAGWSSLLWLHRVRQPTLILAGDDDPLIPLRNARLMTRLIPRARLHVIHGGGHLFLLESPTECARLIDRFLSDAVPATATAT
jgi:poly(3-hydroxyalkanoate) depolymerase